MTRSRGSYLGGSTVHIPGRDSNGSDAPPPKALERARLQASEEDEMCARITDYLARLDRHIGTAGLDKAKAFVTVFNELKAEGESIDYTSIVVRSPALKAAIFRLKLQLDLFRLLGSSSPSGGGGSA